MASLSRPPTSLRSCCSARCTGCTLVQDPIRPGSQQSCRADRRVVAAASGSGADGCTTATPTELVQQQPGSRTARPLLVGASAVAASLSAAAAHAAEAAGSAAAAATAGPIPPGTFTPGPYEPGWEIWVGFVAGVVPFIIATVEFTKRIIIQRRCPACSGRGLVQRGRYLRKCPECGGLLPWLGWKEFFFSTATPGNGGPLLQPRGQTSVFYRVPPPPTAEQQVQAQQAQQAEQQAAGAAQQPAVQQQRQQQQ
ncbi:hypothetical protein C2E20_1799 [Micractinium conductrix]|uniref:Uncharacterized protein n=1 Tax=Micractinium conductrix TaxID=554055 RepID=A0A2P6VLV9_9CHLO|nr:hypothetical protein C2E20_1799 [Micractinium conductrix]|eukprot:PSC75045.1 hypothetical protein C2E20_1799 [Micractinium conductrix]